MNHHSQKNIFWKGLKNWQNVIKNMQLICFKEKKYMDIIVTHFT